jgi:hypothetical protein
MLAIVSQIIPLVNVIALFCLALAEWPIHRQIRESGPPL